MNKNENKKIPPFQVGFFYLQIINVNLRKLLTMSSRVIMVAFSAPLCVVLLQKIKHGVGGSLSIDRKLKFIIGSFIIFCLETPFYRVGLSGSAYADGLSERSELKRGKRSLSGILHIFPLEYFFDKLRFSPSFYGGYYDSPQGAQCSMLNYTMQCFAYTLCIIYCVMTNGHF